MIDLRSDTFTLPSKEMKEMMFSVKLGDDVFGEDDADDDVFGSDEAAAESGKTETAEPVEVSASVEEAEVSPVKKKEEEYNQLIASADKEYGAEKYEEAIVWFDRVLEIEPNHKNSIKSKQLAVNAAKLDK